MHALESAVSEMQCQLAKSSFQFSISKVSQLNGRLYSSETPTGAIGNVHWRCFIEPHQGDDGKRYLSFGFDIISRQTLCGGGPDAATDQIYPASNDNETLCTVDVIVMLFNRKSRANHIRLSRIEHFNCSNEFAWDRVIQWSTLIDSDSGFLQRDELQFGVDLCVGTPQDALVKLAMPVPNVGYRVEANHTSAHDTPSAQTKSAIAQHSGTSESEAATPSPSLEEEHFPGNVSEAQSSTCDTSGAELSNTESTQIDTQFPSATFLLTVHNISKLSGKIYSKPGLLRDIEWRCYVSPREIENGEKFLEVGLRNESERQFKGAVLLEIKMRNQLGVRQEFDDRRVEQFSSGAEMGWKRFLPWDHLLADSTEGFVKDDSISLTIFVHVLPGQQEMVSDRKLSSPEENNNSPKEDINSPVVNNKSPVENNNSHVENNNSPKDNNTEENNNSAGETQSAKCEIQVTSTGTQTDDQMATDTRIPRLKNVSDIHAALRKRVSAPEPSVEQKSAPDIEAQKDTDIESGWITSASQLVDSLHCPVCHRLLEPPVFLCGTGHSICNRCEPHTVICPVCHNVFLERVRNHTVEKLMNFVRYPCDVSIECTTKSAPNERQTHAGECPHRVFSDWLWRHGPLIGFEDDSQSHRTRAIPFTHYAGITFTFPLSLYGGKDFHKSAHIFTFDGEMFRLRLIKFRDLYFMCIDVFGPTSDAKEYRARVVVLSKEAIAAKCSARAREALLKNQHSASASKSEQLLSDYSLKLSDNSQRGTISSSDNSPSTRQTSPPTSSTNRDQFLNFQRQGVSKGNCSLASSAVTARNLEYDGKIHSLPASSAFTGRNLEYDCKIHGHAENVAADCIPLPSESMLLRNHCDTESKLHVMLCVAKK